MLQGLIAILFFQCAGEVLSRSISTTIPGPVIGLLLLLAFLFARKRSPPALTHVADALLNHLGLLFIPAAVGVLVYAAQLREHGAALLMVIVGSTLATAVVTALVLQAFNRMDRLQQADAVRHPPDSAPDTTADCASKNAQSAKSGREVPDE